VKRSLVQQLQFQGNVFNFFSSFTASGIDLYAGGFASGAAGKITAPAEPPGAALSVSNTNSRDIAPFSEADETKLLNSTLQYIRLLAANTLCTPTNWTAQITDKGTRILAYCHHSRICRDRPKGKQRSSLDSGILVNQHLQALKISGVGPERLSRQYKTRFEIPTTIVLRVEAG